MSVRVEFVELSGASYRDWPDAAEAPAVGDQVDVTPVGDEDEVVATVVRREWFDGGRGVVCYIESR